jgi:hypothetical protein
MAITRGPLGRVVPPDFDHTSKWALRVRVAERVERRLALPSWHWTHNQGSEGSCVGHGTAMERAITNGSQNRLARMLRPTRRYDPIDIWNAAKVVDGDPDTNPGDDNGTYVRAAYDVMRDRGPARVRSMKLLDGKPTPVRPAPPDVTDGAIVNRWANSVDDLRSCIGKGVPAVIGVNWYARFDDPTQVGAEWWMARSDQHLGQVRGGHCVCVYGASDRRQAFAVKNSWGRSYPLAWLPYEVMVELLREDGEATVITDR